MRGQSHKKLTSQPFWVRPNGIILFRNIFAALQPLLVLDLDQLVLLQVLAVSPAAKNIRLRFEVVLSAG